MLRRIDVPPTLVMALKMQTARRDDAKQGLQRCEGHRGLRCLGEPGALSALHIDFVLRRLAISTFCGDTLTQTFGVLWQIQNIGVTAFAWNWIALRNRQWNCCTSSSGCKCLSNEITAASFALSHDCANSFAIQEIFWSFLNAARVCAI